MRRCSCRGTTRCVLPRFDPRYTLLIGRQGTAPFLNSPLAALQNQTGLNVLYAFGTNVSTNDTIGFSEALVAASIADLTIYVGGIDGTIEGEANDRTNISWPGNQLDLIQELGKVSKQLVVYQLGGGQVDDTFLLLNPQVHALLWAGYPGQDGGPAMIDILFGNQAPAGRLPVTQYPAGYVDEVRMTDMGMRPSSTGNPGRTYKWYDGAVIPFGYGLHYTHFLKSASNGSPQTYQTSQLASMTSGTTLYPDQVPFANFTVGVTNSGSVTSDYVAMAFLTGEFGPQPYPYKSLVSYTRLHAIAPGATATATFNLTMGSLARADSNGNFQLWPGNYSLVVDTVEPAVIASWEIEGDNQMLIQWPTSS